MTGAAWSLRKPGLMMSVHSLTWALHSGPLTLQMLAPGTRGRKGATVAGALSNSRVRFCSRSSASRVSPR